ncbi:MAG: epoxyqueuosine reductase [Chloroflexota bacterium]
MSAEKVAKPDEMAGLVEKEILAFWHESPLNRLPEPDNIPIFEEPLVGFASGDDAIFTEFKTMIGPKHLTPREAMARTLKKSSGKVPPRLSVIGWALIFTRQVRNSNRRRSKITARIAALAREHGGRFNNALREHLVAFLKRRGHLAVAPLREAYFIADTHSPGGYSNWSERHVAYATGLGTFGLSDQFITERGISPSTGSVITDLVLPPGPRAGSLYANCLFYAGVDCRACIGRCPAGAISASSRDRAKCRAYNLKHHHLKEKYGVRMPGCGLCQTRVPCEARNPTRKLAKK